MAARSTVIEVEEDEQQQQQQQDQQQREQQAAAAAPPAANDGMRDGNGLLRNRPRPLKINLDLALVRAPPAWLSVAY